MPSRDRLGDKEAAPQVGVENEVPVVPGDIERGFADIASGVVDQDVDLAEGGLSLLGHSLDAGWSRTSSASETARRPSASISASNAARCLALAAGEDEIGAGLRQGAGEILPEPAAGSGDKRDLAGQIEQLLGSSMRLLAV